MSIVFFFGLGCESGLNGGYRLDDVEAKLADTEKEADKARKESRNARDYFNEIKSKRYV